MSEIKGNRISGDFSWDRDSKEKFWCGPFELKIQIKNFKSENEEALLLNKNFKLINNNDEFLIFQKTFKESKDILDYINYLFHESVRMNKGWYDDYKGYWNLDKNLIFNLRKFIRCSYKYGFRPEQN